MFRIPHSLVLISLFSFSAGAGGANAAPATARIDAAQSTIEALFRTARYDSLLRVIDDYERIALETNDSLLAGRMLVQRGRVRLMTGRFAESVSSIDAGIEAAQAAGDTSGWMPALTFKGYALAGLGRYNEALECYRKRLLLARRVGSPLDEAWALTNIAYVQHARGEQESARDNYTRAMFLFRAGERTDLEVTPLIGLGRVRSAMGDAPGAIRCYQRAWIVARDIGDRENEMWAANNLGALESVRGDMTRAIQYAQRAYEIAREMGYPRGAILPAINIASWRMELGEFKRAEAILNDAEAYYEESGEDEYRAKIEFHKARLALNRGQYHAAAATFRRLLAQGRLEPQNRDFAWVELASALALCDSGAVAIDILSQRLGSGYRWYADSGTSARLVLSKLLLRNNDPEAALTQAEFCREEAEDQGWRQTAVSARLRETACYRALGRGEEALGSLSAALDSLDSMRGGQSEPEWREAYGQHTSADVLDACRAVLDYPESVPRTERERSFYEVVQQFKTRTLLERIAAPRSTGAAPATRVRPITLELLQSDLLSPDDLLLDIVAGETESILFAVTADSLRVVRLPGSLNILQEKAAIYRAVLSDPSASSQELYTAPQLRAMQVALGRVLLGAVSDLLPLHRRIWVSPDGFFALIPFGTLAVPAANQTTDTPASTGRLLVETHDVIELHSAGALTLSREGDHPTLTHPARVCVIVPPQGRGLPGAMDEARAVERAYESVEITRGLEGGAEELALLATRFEVAHIAAHALVNDESPWNSGFDLAPPGEAQAYGKSASDSSSGSLRAATPVIKILSREDSIVVTNTFRKDHWLRAWQIARLSLPFEMAVLAGCETAGGRATTGEGVLGLTAAFTSAGVPIVISTLWPVDDRSTARLMKSFYRHLATGTPVATALRRAQLEIRGPDGSTHPFYWAGFTVVGDGTREIRMRRAPRTRWLARALLLSAAAIVMMVIIRKRRSSLAVAS